MDASRSSRHSLRRKVMVRTFANGPKLNALAAGCGSALFRPGTHSLCRRRACKQTASLFYRYLIGAVRFTAAFDPRRLPRLKRERDQQTISRPHLYVREPIFLFPPCTMHTCHAVLPPLKSHPPRHHVPSHGILDGCSLHVERPDHQCCWSVHERGRLGVGVGWKSVL